MAKKKKRTKVKGINSSEPEKELKVLLEEKGCIINTQFKIDNLLYDLVVEGTNILIEFNGDYFHCNPELYEANYKNKKLKLLAHQIWEKDRKKKELAEKNGFKLLTIWEREFNLDKERVIKNVLKEIKNEKNTRSFKK